MDDAGVRGTAARIASVLRRARTGPAMRHLAGELTAALRARPRTPAGVREVSQALCEELAALRGGRPVELRFERFPDEIEVTGLCVEFEHFDLVIVEERAEEVQQLVILGHELWHLHAGHDHRGTTGTAAARVLAVRPAWRDLALAVAARNGSRAQDEGQAEDFGHRLAATLRPLLYGGDDTAAAPLEPVQRSLGYRGRRGGTDRR
ncbi:toxin-antitoxin system, toxin component family protein [Streptomyces bobili]|uniref:toxin-antitoxin system, toxin component family protein n=1 Tax=Streptomyces bobili TaxID=67280 RepID=UPI00381FC1C2